ncbi:MAG: sodium:calcium antiporter [Candidatus Omnitrophica bacterium]|nr:sodium:calcium antiporter [Candidatus Omnitrophota bacterium]
MKQHGGRLQSTLAVAAAIALATQWLWVRWAHPHLPVPWNALLPGLAIFGAAFLLSWGAELAQLDIPQALALAVLALIAVLPEYAVDMYFAWRAGQDPAYIPYATANMTGANRLLIGIGWPAALLACWLGSRKREIHLDQAQAVEIATLFIATVYSFLIPLKGTLSLVDTLFFIGLFVIYMICASRSHHVEPELGGPSEWIAAWQVPARRMAMGFFFLLAGTAILVAAEPFAEGLLSVGRAWGIEEFLLVQWLAPLASESPEFIVAVLFALRGAAGAAMGTLISSKVNQWTLLIGMLPLAFCVSGGHLQAMPLDKRQVEEIFLTSAQSFLAVSVLSNFSFSAWEAITLMGLFTVQMVFPSTQVRYFFGGLYLVLTAVLLLGNTGRRRSVLSLLTRSWKPGR